MLAFVVYSLFLSYKTSLSTPTEVLNRKDWKTKLYCYDSKHPVRSTICRSYGTCPRSVSEGNIDLFFAVTPSTYRTFLLSPPYVHAHPFWHVQSCVHAHTLRCYQQGCSPPPPFNSSGNRGDQYTLAPSSFRMLSPPLLNATANSCMYYPIKINQDVERRKSVLK